MNFRTTDQLLDTVLDYYRSGPTGGYILLYHWYNDSLPKHLYSYISQQRQIKINFIKRKSSIIPIQDFCHDWIWVVKSSI